MLGIIGMGHGTRHALLPCMSTLVKFSLSPASLASALGRNCKSVGTHNYRGILNSYDLGANEAEIAFFRGNGIEDFAIVPLSDLWIEA